MTIGMKNGGVLSSISRQGLLGWKGSMENGGEFMASRTGMVKHIPNLAAISPLGQSDTHYTH
jgi:hypothetical protein